MKDETIQPPPVERKFLHDKRIYFARFALQHRAEMRRLIEGGLMDKGHKDWRNAAEHNLLAGVIAYKIGSLVDLSQEDLSEVTSVATIHDWDKKLTKEQTKKDEQVEQGTMLFGQYDVDKLIQIEKGKTGLVRVTGIDWRDFETWGLKEKILRYVDSSLVPTPDGHADFVNWEQRLSDLRKRFEELDKKAGEELYNGIPLYDKLAEITEIIENELYQLIITRHPRLKEKYPKKEMLSDLIRDRIIEDISHSIKYQEVENQSY